MAREVEELSGLAGLRRLRVHFSSGVEEEIGDPVLDDDCSCQSCNAPVVSGYDFIDALLY